MKLQGAASRLYNFMFSVGIVPGTRSAAVHHSGTAPTMSSKYGIEPLIPLDRFYTKFKVVNLTQDPLSSLISNLDLIRNICVDTLDNKTT